MSGNDKTCTRLTSFAIEEYKKRTKKTKKNSHKNAGGGGVSFDDLIKSNKIQEEKTKKENQK